MGIIAERCLRQMKRGNYCAAVEKIEQKRKREDFFASPQEGTIYKTKNEKEARESLFFLRLPRKNAENFWQKRENFAENGAGKHKMCGKTRKFIKMLTFPPRRARKRLF